MSTETADARVDENNEEEVVDQNAENPRRRRRSNSPVPVANDVAKRARSRSPVQVPKAGDDWVEKPVERPAEKPKSTNPLQRVGGAYIPPAKLRMMQQQLESDKTTEAYQRMNWEVLKKHIHGQVNKVNVENIVDIVRVLLQKNVVRGMGLLASSILKAQTFSPSFSHVYAALVAIINSKFPNIGQLILKRLVIQFKRAFSTNNKALCVTVCRFLAHLANQRVAHEIVILEILVLLMDKPTDDSIELAITLLKESGEMLSKVIPKGLHSVFERLRAILEDADTIDTRTQYMIEIAMHVRKEKFAGYPAVIDALDLIDEEDQISHMIELAPEDGTKYDPETNLNYFKYDADFEKHEEEYEEIRKKIIGDADDSDEEDEEGDEAGAEEAVVEETPKVQKIIDMTEQDMVAFRRNVYLAIQSSLDFQEAAHKLIKFHLKPGLDDEMCNMIVDCCAQNRTYERFYGLLAERFCRLRLEFQQSFERIARDTYKTIHRFDIKKIRIMAQLVAHLLSTDAIDWGVLSEIKMNENDTSSAGRVYVKILFQELNETMGITTLFRKLYDPTISHHFEGLLPRDHPKNTRFAINFFTVCGLGGLTMILREHYEKKMKKAAKEEVVSEDSSSSSSSSSSDSSDDDSSSSSSSSSSSASEAARRKKKSKSKKEAAGGDKRRKRSKSKSVEEDNKQKVQEEIRRLQIEQELRRRDRSEDEREPRRRDRSEDEPEPRRRDRHDRSKKRESRRRDEAAEDRHRSHKSATRSRK